MSRRRKIALLFALSIVCLFSVCADVGARNWWAAAKDFVLTIALFCLALDTISPFGVRW